MLVQQLIGILNHQEDIYNTIKYNKYYKMESEVLYYDKRRKKRIQ